MITCNHGPKALCDTCKIDLQRNELETMRANLAAMQARAERAERERDEARRLLAWCWDCDTLMGLFAPGAGSYRCPKCAKLSTPAPIREVVVFEQRIAALESRLAEVAPVVEAAEAWSRTAEEEPLMVAVRALRAARSLRGAGGGA